MGADETSKPVRAPRQHKRDSNRPGKSRALARMKKALDKAQRESHEILIEEFETETPKGVDVSQGNPQSHAPGPLMKLPSLAPNPSSSVTEANPEVEWAFGRTYHTKRSPRRPRKIDSH